MKLKYFNGFNLCQGVCERYFEFGQKNKPERLIALAYWGLLFIISIITLWDLLLAYIASYKAYNVTSAPICLEAVWPI